MPAGDDDDDDDDVIRRGDDRCHRVVVILIDEIGQLALAPAAPVAEIADPAARGIFGTPNYVYEAEIFWGQDRLEFLDRRLAETE